MSDKISGEPQVGSPLACSNCGSVGHTKDECTFDPDEWADSFRKKHVPELPEGATVDADGTVRLEHPVFPPNRSINTTSSSGTKPNDETQLRRDSDVS
jgi:hypothetical protein